MSRVTFVASLLSVLVLLCQVPAQERDGGDVRATVDAYLDPLVESQLFSGSVLLAKGGAILVDAGYGIAHFGDRAPNTADTRFKLMSVTKPLTAVALMTLTVRGKLALDDRVSKHLPGWPDAWREVTVRHLLSHSSGIPNLEMEWVAVQQEAGKRGLELWPRLAAKVADRELTFAPGSRPGYSNFNFVLLGFVLEAISGAPYLDCLRAAVLEPVEMRHTGLDDGSRLKDLAMGYFLDRDGSLRESRQDMSIIEAAGGLYSTPGDLYRLDRALRGDDLLPAAVKQVLHTPVVANLACGWQVSRVLERLCIHHSGGSNGYVAEFLRFPEVDACVVVLSNFAFAPIGRIARDLASILLGEPFAAPTTMPSEALDRRSGVYHSTTGKPPILIRRVGRRLVTHRLYEGAGRSVGQLLVPLSDGTFGTAAAGPYRLRFLEQPDGAVGRLRFEGSPGADPLDVLERSAIDREPWRQMRGTYDVEPHLGDAVGIAEAGGELVMLTGDGLVTLVPVSREVALAFYRFGNVGSRFERRPADGDAPVGFIWQANPGRIFRGVLRGTGR